MNEIQKMEYSLLTIRYLFMLQAEEKIVVDYIHLLPDYDFLNGSSFKTEALEYAIKHDNSTLKNKFKRIFHIANEIIEIWENQLHSFRANKEPGKEYKIFCSPRKNTDFPFDPSENVFYQCNFDLPKIELTGNFFIKENRWWTSISPFDSDRISKIESNENCLNAFPLQFYDFAKKLIHFLKAEIMMEEISHSESEHKSESSLYDSVKIFKKGELYHILNAKDPRERIEYYRNTIDPLIQKDSKFDTCNNRKEAYENAKRNAALLFDVDMSEIENMRDGFMPRKVHADLFEPYDIEHWSVHSERQALLFWDSIKSEIDTELDKCKRAQIPVKDKLNELLQKYSSSYETLKYDPEHLRFERICYDKYIEPYLKKKLADENVVPYNFNDNEKENSTITNAKPIFNTDKIDTIFNLLKVFFAKEDHSKLLELLETGNDLDEPLIFLDNGNRLADSFKQLIKSDTITGCTQKKLESWISENFRYKYRQEIKVYTLRYLNDIISSNKDLCQNPILNVKIVDGKTSIVKA